MGTACAQSAKAKHFCTTTSACALAKALVLSGTCRPGKGACAVSRSRALAGLTKVMGNQSAFALRSWLIARAARTAMLVQRAPSAKASDRTCTTAFAAKNAQRVTLHRKMRAKANSVRNLFLCFLFKLL